MFRCIFRLLTHHWLPHAARREVHRRSLRSKGHPNIVQWLGLHEYFFKDSPRRYIAWRERRFQWCCFNRCPWRQMMTLSKSLAHSNLTMYQVTAVAAIETVCFASFRDSAIVVVYRRPSKCVQTLRYTDVRQCVKRLASRAATLRLHHCPLKVLTTCKFLRCQRTPSASTMTPAVLEILLRRGRHSPVDLVHLLKVSNQGARRATRPFTRRLATSHRRILEGGFPPSSLEIVL